ncbi:MAG: hypothetical protein R3B72_34880 [Polyangiaceae bacterium]
MSLARPLGTRGRLIAGLLAVGLAFAPARAAADDDAAAIEAEARAAFDQGRYEEAAEGFARAHRISPAAITKYNEGFSWQKAGRPAEQADAYEAALIIGTLDADRTTHARKRLAELDEELGVLIIRQPVGAMVYVAHAQGREVPARVHLAPGEHDVVVRTTRQTHREAVRIKAGQERFLAFPADPPDVVEPPPSVGSPVSIQEIFGWTSVGLGAGAAVASVALGGAFLAARGEFIDGGQVDPDLRQKAIDLQLATNVVAASAALLGGLGLTLLLTAPHDPAISQKSSLESPRKSLREGAVELRVDAAGIRGVLRW